MQATNDIKYKVRLKVFEGPLDLLLYLVRKDELDINNIPISIITHQYLEYLNFIQSMDIELAGEYIYMAALLLSIKTKSLIPQKVKDSTSADEIDSEELSRLLIEYKRFKQFGEKLRILLDKEKIRYPVRNVIAPTEVKVSVPIEFIVLMKVAWNLLKRQDRITLESIEEEIDIRSKMDEIDKFLESKKRIKFIDLFLENQITRISFVSTFFALLELIRLGNIIVRQSRPFSEVWVYVRKNLRQA